MFINKSVLIPNQTSNVSLQIVRNFIPKNFLSGLLPKVDEKKKSRRLKKWRNSQETANDNEFLYMLKREKPNKVFTSFIGRGSLSPAEDLQIAMENLRTKILDQDQKFIPERHQTLGNDLAVAHIIVSREGKVRRLNSEKFITIDEIDDLPTTYDHDWFLEEIDCSNMPISYDGLINLDGLKYLKRATYKNCEFFDNWCLDRVVVLCPHLEYLEVTNCKRVDEKGLECLYKASNLKEFVVTDWHEHPQFELACLLLEDSKPGLVVKRLVIPPEDRPSDSEDSYTPSIFETMFMKFEKYIHSLREVKKQ